MKLNKSAISKILILLIGCYCFLSCNPANAYDQDAEHYNELGITYTKKGSYEQAISYFKKAIESDSSLTNAYYNLGSVYKHTGNKDKALKAFQLLLRNCPNDDETAYLIASLYFEKQDYEKALIYLNSIEKTSQSYKDSMDLFKKINQKINDSVIEEPAKPAQPKPAPLVTAPAKTVLAMATPANTSKLTFSGFNGPTGIAEDSQGNLYVANYITDTIEITPIDGKPKKIIKNELLRGPVGIAIDSKDNIYVANYPLNNVVKIDKSGAVKVVLKDVVKPYYLYLNKSGVLYVSEQDKNTVIRIGIPE